MNKETKKELKLLKRMIKRLKKMYLPPTKRWFDRFLNYYMETPELLNIKRYGYSVLSVRQLKNEIEFVIIDNYVTKKYIFDFSKPIRPAIISTYYEMDGIERWCTKNEYDINRFNVAMKALLLYRISMIEGYYPFM